MSPCIKGVMLMFALVGVLSFGFEADAFWHDANLRNSNQWSSKPCKTAIAQKVLKEKEKTLQGAWGCKVETVPLGQGPQKVSLVHVQHGAPMDCPAGCIYNVYTALVVNNTVIDFDGAPNLDHFLGMYGDWCQLSPTDIKNKNINVFITQRNDVYYWGYRLKKFNNRPHINNLLKTSPQHRASNMPQYCQWDGELVFTGERDDFKSVDASKLTFALKPWPKATKRSVASLLKECRAKKFPAFKDDLGKNNCIKGVAIGKQDVRICDALTLQDLYKSSMPAEQLLQEQRFYCREAAMKAKKI